MGARIEVDPALVRGSEVKRLVGGNARLLTPSAALPYADFDATLAWMLDQSNAAGAASIGLNLSVASNAQLVAPMAAGFAPVRGRLPSRMKPPARETPRNRQCPTTTNSANLKRSGHPSSHPAVPTTPKLTFANVRIRTRLCSA